MANGLDLILCKCENEIHTFYVYLRRRELDHIKTTIQSLETFPIDIDSIMVYPNEIVQDGDRYDAVEYHLGLRVYTFTRDIVATFDMDNNLRYNVTIEDERYTWNDFN